MRVGDIVKKKRKYGADGDHAFQKMPVGFVTHVLKDGACKVKWIKADRHWKDWFLFDELSVIKNPITEHDWDTMR